MSALKVEGTSSASFRATNITPVPIQYRTGDVVVVQALRVQDIADGANEVLIKHPDGNLLTAVLSGRFTGKEGDYFSIRMRSFDDKRVYADVVSNINQSKTLQNEIIHWLTHFNIPNTEDNYQIMMQMLRNGIPVNDSYFELLKKYKKQYPKTPSMQLTFMVRNNIPVDETTVKVIETLIMHDGLIGERLIRLFGLISDKNKNDELKNLLKHFYKNPQDEAFDPSDIKISRTISDLAEILSDLKICQCFGEDTNRIIQSFVRDMGTNLALLQGLQNILYLQIPISNNGLYDTAELYILKENGDNQQKVKEQMLFLRIPTFHLGVVEVFVYIDSKKNMQCHFQSEEHINYIKKNIGSLYELLNNTGYRLTKLTYDHLPPGISIHNFERYAKLITDPRKFDEKV